VLLPLSLFLTIQLSIFNGGEIKMEITLKELILDLELKPETITNNELIESIAIKAILVSGAKIYGTPKIDTWQPHGLQFYVTLTTSHAIFTTYPEANYLTINYATCGPVDFKPFIATILEELKPVKIIRQYQTIRTPNTTCDFKPEDCKKYPKCSNCSECKQ
jgi:S-adenosylmethionine/arginine decarboxylase-like enzyme